MNPELKVKVREAIITTLEKDYDKKNVDALLADAVESVLDEQKPVSTGIRYIGKRDNYEDALYGTGMWKKGQAKLVELSAATKMVGHPDTYEAVDGELPENIEQVVPKKDDGEYSDSLIAGRQAVMTMERVSDVAEFVTTNFAGVKLDLEVIRDDINEAKLRAIQLIDRFHLPDSIAEETPPPPSVTEQEEDNTAGPDPDGLLAQPTQVEAPKEYPLEEALRKISDAATKKEVLDAVKEVAGEKMRMTARARLDEYRKRATDIIKKKLK